MALLLSSRLLLRLINRGGTQDFSVDLPALRRVAGQPQRPLHKPRRLVASVQDTQIPGPGGWLGVRLYRPKQPAVGFILFLHGGGFVHCGLDSHDAIACQLTRHSGCIVVSVDYRLAPEHPFPAAVQDCWAALTWLAGQRHGLGLPAGRIAVAGDSAGATLAADMSLLARKHGGPAIDFQLLFYPATGGGQDSPSKQRYADGYLLSAAMMDWYAHQYVGADPDRSDELLAPILADHAGLPPAYLATAEYDPLRDEGAVYAEALRAAGVPVTARCYGGLFHGFLNFHHLQPRALIALRNGARALRAALKNKISPTSAPPG